MFHFLFRPHKSIESSKVPYKLAHCTCNWDWYVYFSTPIQSHSNPSTYSSTALHPDGVLPKTYIAEKAGLIIIRSYTTNNALLYDFWSSGTFRMSSLKSHRSNVGRCGCGIRASFGRLSFGPVNSSQFPPNPISPFANLAWSLKIECELSFVKLKTFPIPMNWRKKRESPQWG